MRLKRTCQTLLCGWYWNHSFQRYQGTKKRAVQYGSWVCGERKHRGRNYSGSGVLALVRALQLIINVSTVATLFRIASRACFATSNWTTSKTACSTRLSFYISSKFKFRRGNSRNPNPSCSNVILRPVSFVSQ